MIPSFPTLTWPNHVTLATGLYPSSHGIVGNIFTSTTLNSSFDYMDFAGQSNPSWYAGTPIWKAVEDEGLLAAVCMWPGSKNEETRPTYYREWDWRVSHSQRIDIAMDWLSLPTETRPTLIALYLSDVDHAGHYYGPETPQVNKNLADLDADIGSLLTRVETLSGKPWFDTLNVIVVSDHGMGEGNTISKFVFLDDFVDASRFEVVDDVMVHIYPNEGEDIDAVFNAWKQASLSSGNWHIWKRQDIPSYFHYNSPIDRIGPIVALPNSGWAVSKRTPTPLFKPHEVKGMHGYNNTDPDMRAIFMAAGPSFKKHDAAIQPFENVEIHNLVARVMGLQALGSLENNGTLNAFMFDEYLNIEK
ncbi:hypothetical protein HDU98_009877 [Podochytrium sp. JEL0797]|nr:hypothetical protein HDU98_009877 [Podochytrium sp. JEL0797]